MIKVLIRTGNTKQVHDWLRRVREFDSLLCYVALTLACWTCCEGEPAPIGSGASVGPVNRAACREHFVRQDRVSRLADSDGELYDMEIT